MNLTRTITTACMALAVSTSGAFAEQVWGFANVSANYLTWSDQARDDAGKSDFGFLELEGGAGFTWGDVYGFIDFENPVNMDWQPQSGDSGSQFRVAAKGVVQVNIGETNFNYYGHIYSFTDSSGFYDQSLVAGLSYDFNTDFGLTFRPFLGVHFEHGNYIGSGYNGGMAGWTAMYNFELMGEKFMLTNWNEIEFGRVDEAIGANGESWGLNGAVGAWWQVTEKFSTGVQYRYADNKLGSDVYQDGLIFTAKYSF